VDGGRVLVVDDEAPVRRLISAIVRQTGCTVAEAADGRAAMDTLAREPFDLVITDLRMPRMGGMALLEECRSLYPETDVMVLTAYGTIPSAVEAVRLGALDYISKPFVGDDLAQRVRRCLEARRARSRPPSPVGPLVELGRILTQAYDGPAMLERVVDLVQSTFAPASICLALFGAPSADRIALSVDILAAAGAQSPADLGFPGPTIALARLIASRRTPWVLREPGPLDETDLDRTEGQAITVPLVNGSDVLGWMTLVRPGDAPRYTASDAQLLYVFAFQIGSVMLPSRARQQLAEALRTVRRATLATVRTLFAAIKAFDQYTHDHCERVSRYAYLLGKRLGLAPGELEHLRIGALLHDVGKIGIGDGTVRKRGRLTTDEIDRVRLHPIMGASILSDMDAFADIVPMVKYHHECFDGSGYPSGLAGDAIPLGGRIIAVVDAFDSMTTDRPYRRALPIDDALERLHACAGSQLDPQHVAAWAAIVGEGGHVLPDARGLDAHRQGFSPRSERRCGPFSQHD
jgi:putative nucleotidyltransferase with HDIG domain